MADQLAGTLKGTEAAGIVAATSLVEIAARRLLEMEARDTTGAARSHPRPHRGGCEREGVHVNEFIATYTRLKPAGGRTWTQIVASADPENEEMLKALTAGGGRLRVRRQAAVRDPQEGLRSDQRPAARAAHTRERQAPRGRLQREVQARASRRPVRDRSRGLPIATGAVRGRDAALTEEYLNAPDAKELGGRGEVEWIAASAAREANATKAEQRDRRVAARHRGDARDQGADEGVREAHRDAEQGVEGPANKRRQDAILAEMKRVRATLTGDTAAYEDENDAMRTQIRSAVSLAVQVGLAFALPGCRDGAVRAARPRPR